YVPFSKFDFFKSSSIIKSLASVSIAFLPQPDDKKSKFNFLYRLADLASKSGLETYLSAGVDIIEGFENNLIHKHSPDMDLMRNDFNRIVSYDMSGLKKIMNLDFDINLCSDLLVKMDIATMAHSLEGRSPFLSKELLEYVPTINDSFKINGTTTKFILRELAVKYLPAELINQPKRGFEIPLKNWVNGVLKDLISDYVLSESALNKSILNESFVQKLVDSKVRIPAEKRAKILWMLFCMEVWYKKHKNKIV
ncbi:MAG: asparagine synthase-related protein, partial [Ferruginibacter sp.]